MESPRLCGSDKEMNGVVKWFNSSKGYGFINCNDGEDVFVHYQDIQSSAEYRTLNEGDEVSFSTEDTEKGKKAKNVEVIS